ARLVALRCGDIDHVVVGEMVRGAQFAGPFLRGCGAGEGQGRRTRNGDARVPLGIPTVASTRDQFEAVGDVVVELPEQRFGFVLRDGNDVAVRRHEIRRVPVVAV